MSSIEKGNDSNTESDHSFDSEEEAKAFYIMAKDRLLHVNEWHKLAGTGSANFQLTDEKGTPVNRPAREGDHFKIDIPGPGTVTGEGNDWVRVEAVEETDDSIIIRVRPATNPLNERKDIAHFFSDEATSSFSVRREKNKVVAGVYGRNEKPNTDTEKTIDKVRNAAVAAGAVTGFSKLQWKSLVKGIARK